MYSSAFQAAIGLTEKRSLLHLQGDETVRLGHEACSSLPDPYEIRAGHVSLFVGGVEPGKAHILRKAFQPYLAGGPPVDQVQFITFTGFDEGLYKTPEIRLHNVLRVNGSFKQNVTD